MYVPSTTRETSELVVSYLLCDYGGRHHGSTRYNSPDTSMDGYDKASDLVIPRYMNIYPGYIRFEIIPSPWDW